MTASRADVDIDSLLRIVLLLAIVWLALEIVGEVLNVLGWLFGSLRPLLGLVVVVLVVLWLLDRV